MKKILVIEDNTDVRENILELLELSNYEVMGAENGKEGADLAIRQQPDLILCDVMMPDLDGYGVLRILGKRSETAHIPFIFLTAKAEREDFRKGMNLGADDYITKPFDDVELLDAIELRLRKSTQLKSSFDRAEGGLEQFLHQARSFAAFETLTEQAEKRTYRKKAVIFEEGAYPRQVYYVESGKVKIFKTNDYGKELITEIVKEGEFLGYLPVVQDAKYPASAATLEECQLSIIPKKLFLDLLYKDPQVSAQLIKVLARHITEQEELLLNLAYDSVRKRVGEALLRLYDNYEKDGRAEVSILREDLAHLVGTSKETVIRTLSEFKDDELIRLDGGTIIIDDRSKLEDLPY